MYESGSYPRYAWSTDPTGETGYTTDWTLTQLAGQAPSGQDAIRIEHITKTLGTDNETSAWWTKDWTAAVTAGTKWVVRFRLRMPSGQSWRRASDGTSGIDAKVTIVGDPGEHDPYQPTRCIALMATGGGVYDEVAIRACQNIGPCGAYLFNRPQNVWHSVQIVCQSSSTDAASDGYVEMYWNNNVEGSPDTTTGLTRIRTGGWSSSTSDAGLLRFGLGTVRSILTGNQLSVDFADFQLATLFDSGWAP